MFPSLPTTWNRTEFDYSLFYQTIEMAFLTAVSFLLPVVLMHPQLLVGAAVNAMLIRGAFSLRGYRMLPLIVMPSLGVVTVGVLFGSLTSALLYMVPLIWVGNALLVHLFKTGLQRNYFRVLARAATFKAVFLFFGALILYSFNLIPAGLLAAMSYLQLVTALLGGIVVYGELQVEKRWFPRK